QRQDGRRHRDDDAVHPRMTHSGRVDDMAVVVQRPVPLRERMPPTARGDVVRLAEGGEGKPDRRHEPDDADRDQDDVDRRASNEADETLAPRPRGERNRLFDGGHQATTRSLRNRRTFNTMTGAISTSMITATAAP